MHRGIAPFQSPSLSYLQCTVILNYIWRGKTQPETLADWGKTRVIWTWRQARKEKKCNKKNGGIFFLQVTVLLAMLWSILIASWFTAVAQHWLVSFSPWFIFVKPSRNETWYRSVLQGLFSSSVSVKDGSTLTLPLEKTGEIWTQASLA